MMDAQVIEGIRDKYAAIADGLGERARRRWAAAEARSIGWGGVTAVAAATGISDRTIRTGIRELDNPNPLPAGRQRREGGGRRSRDFERCGLTGALEALIEPMSRGDLTSPLHWTCKGIRTLAEELRRQGFQVSCNTVAKILRASGYSLQANRTTTDRGQHRDRDAQFRQIDRRVRAFHWAKEPVISLEITSKEPLGNMENAGQAHPRTGNARRVDTHDFPESELGKAAPSGADVVTHNELGVSVGVSNHTAEFAVAAIRRWWQRMGLRRYPQTERLLITADGGGSDNPRTRLWRWALQQFADETGLTIELCHFPPGTSKWSRIEHRLFCHITSNWQGIPLETHEIVVNLIAAPGTRRGLEVHDSMDGAEYQKSETIMESHLSEVRVVPSRFHGEWNYKILPRDEREIR